MKKTTFWLLLICIPALAQILSPIFFQGASSCGVPVSGMQAWYASDNGPLCSGTCTNGATITGFNDLSSNSRNSTSVYGSPTFVTNAINGKPSIRCSSGHCGITISPSIAEPAAHTWTIFAVGNQGCPSVCNNSSFIGCAGVSCFTYYFAGANGHQQSMQSPNTAFGPSGTAAPAAVWEQLNLSYNTSSGAYAYRLARATDGSGTQTISVPNAVDQVFGSVAGGFNIDGNKDTAEIIIYTTILSAGNVTTNETYLNCRYGL